MAIQVISLVNDGTPYLEQTTELDGQDFLFIFSYNARDEHWYMTMQKEDGTPIEGCAGVKLVQGGYPIYRVTDPNRPPGEMFVLGPDSEEPGLLDFGKSTNLLYIPEDDL